MFTNASCCPLKLARLTYLNTVANIYEITEKATEAAKSTVGMKSGEAQGEASAKAGEVKGKAQEVAGEAKGKAQELKGEAKSKL